MTLREFLTQPFFSKTSTFSVANEDYYIYVEGYLEEIITMIDETLDCDIIKVDSVDGSICIVIDFKCDYMKTRRRTFSSLYDSRTYKQTQLEKGDF